MEGVLLPVVLRLPGMERHLVAVERDPSLQIGQELGNREVQAHDPLHSVATRAQSATPNLELRQRHFKLAQPSFGLQR